MENFTVLEQLDDDRFVIEVTPIKQHIPDRLVIAHDYVALTSTTGGYRKNPMGKAFKGPNAICSNVISLRSTVQISIRDFVQVCLPILNAHSYCQEKHLALRNAGTLDAYYGYASFPGKIEYFKDNVLMVAFRCAKENVYNHVTKAFYEEFIVPKLIADKA